MIKLIAWLIVFNPTQACIDKDLKENFVEVMRVGQIIKVGETKPYALRTKGKAPERVTRIAYTESDKNGKDVLPTYDKNDCYDVYVTKFRTYKTRKVWDPVVEAKKRAKAAAAKKKADEKVKAKAAKANK